MVEVLVEVLGSSVALEQVANFWCGLNDVELRSIILTGP